MLGRLRRLRLEQCGADAPGARRLPSTTTPGTYRNPRDQTLGISGEGGELTLRRELHPDGRNLIPLSPGLAAAKALSRQMSFSASEAYMTASPDGFHEPPVPKNLHPSRGSPERPAERSAPSFAYAAQTSSTPSCTIHLPGTLVLSPPQDFYDILIRACVTAFPAGPTRDVEAITGLPQVPK